MILANQRAGMEAPSNLFHQSARATAYSTRLTVLQGGRPPLDGVLVLRRWSRRFPSSRGEFHVLRKWWQLTKRTALVGAAECVADRRCNSRGVRACSVPSRLPYAVPTRRWTATTSSYARANNPPRVSIGTANGPVLLLQTVSFSSHSRSATQLQRREVLLQHQRSRQDAFIEMRRVGNKEGGVSRAGNRR